MRPLIAVVLFMLIVAPSHAQSCSVPGCDAATAEVSAAKATAKTIITEAAPIATATAAVPVMIYVERTTIVTVRETVIITQIVTQIVEVVATSAPVATATTAPPEQPSVTAAPAAPIERVSPIVFVGMVIGALAGLIGAAYFAYRFIFPARDDDTGTQWVQTKKKK